MLVMRVNKSKHSEHIPTWIELYQNGFSSTEIGNQFSVNPVVVLDNLHKQNVEIRPRIETVSGPKHPNWRGQSAGVNSIHRWVKKRLAKPTFCADCKNPPKDLANISNVYNTKTYTRDLANWVWLCRRCHMKRDGRLKNLKNQPCANLAK